MAKPLKYGIVGCGLNSLEHQNELRTSPTLQGRTELIAGFDPDSLAGARLKSLNEVKVGESFEDLLDTDGLEAVIISSPPQFHAEQTISALESGLHVYSEIPMALKESDLEKIVEAERDSGNIYQLGENYCFYREVLYAGFLASSHKIGPIVYSEAEYLHDVTYRWRQGYCGDEETPRVDCWYQLFDPMMYAHSIGPAQVAMGGIESPLPFVEVTSFANDIGGYQGDPICKPAKAFQVALFQDDSEAIAKCANAYIFAREPTRITIQLTGRYGTYECYELDKPGRLFLAKGHEITRQRTRKGEVIKVDDARLSNVAKGLKGLYSGALTRILDDWLDAIEKNKKPKIHAKVGANFCIAGIAASKSARNGGRLTKIKVF